MIRRFLQSSRTPVDLAVDAVMAAIRFDSQQGVEVGSVVAAAIEVRSESIRVEERPQHGGGYGMCARVGEGHVIFVDPHLSGDLREHTILHELGHILLGHNDVDPSQEPSRLTALLTGVEGGSGSCVVPDFRQWAQREADAERFASTVARRLRRSLTTRHLSRLDEVFG